MLLQEPTMRGRSSASLGPNTVKEAISFEDVTTLVLKGELQRVGILATELEGGTSWLYCRIGGGCHLGEDSLDSNSNFQDPACYQVAIHGYGFPTLEGIIHQTIGGFVMTGYAGGSLKHSFADVIREIEFVNGNAEVQIPTPGSGLWCAVGVYMGVFQWYHYPSDIPSSTDAVYRRVRVQPPVCLLHAWTIHEVEERQSKLNRVQEWVGKQSFKNEDLVPYNSIVHNVCAARVAAGILKCCDIILQKEDLEQISLLEYA